MSVDLGSKAPSSTIQVHHRCRCTKPEVCGKTEELAKNLSRAGYIKANFVLP